MTSRSPCPARTLEGLGRALETGGDRIGQDGAGNPLDA